MKTYEDLAKRYDMILCNNILNIDEEAIHNWLEVAETETDEDGEPIEASEPYQWFIIGLSEWEYKNLTETYELDIFYSEKLDNYILPIYHYGTRWSHITLGKRDNS